MRWSSSTVYRLQSAAWTPFSLLALAKHSSNFFIELLDLCFGIAARDLNGTSKVDSHDTDQLITLMEHFFDTQ